MRALYSGNAIEVGVYEVTGEEELELLGHVVYLKTPNGTFAAQRANCEYVDDNFEYKLGTHIVLKVDDINRYLNDTQQKLLAGLVYTINQRRDFAGKPMNDYFVINKKEHYAADILRVIIAGEQFK